MKQTGKRLAHLMENVLRVNREEFCRLAGVSRTSVIAIEQGTGGKRSLEELIETLQLNPQWMHEGKGNIFLSGTEQENVARIKATGSNFQPATNEAYEQVKSERDRLYKDNEFFKQLLSDLSQTYKALAGKSFPNSLRKVPGGMR